MNEHAPHITTHLQEYIIVKKKYSCLPEINLILTHIPNKMQWPSLPIGTKPP